MTSWMKRSAWIIGLVVAGGMIGLAYGQLKPAAKPALVNQSLTNTLHYELKVVAVENLGNNAILGTITANTKEKSGESVWAITLAVTMARTGDRKGGIAGETPPALDPGWFAVYADHPPQHKETKRCQCLGFFTDKTFDQVVYSADRQFAWQGKLAIVAPDKPAKLYISFVDSNIMEVTIP